MIDAKAVDIGVIGNALLGKIVAQIGAVGTDGCGELLQGKIMLQIELFVLAVCL